MVERAYQIFGENNSQTQGLLPCEFLKHYLFFDKVFLIHTQLTSSSTPGVVTVRFFYYDFSNPILPYWSVDPQYCIIEPDLDRTFVVRIYFRE